MVLKVKKQIYDNVHGYIGFTDLELGIIDNPLFQRLRNIIEMGPSNLVFPGATHSRFEHSIGTMHMMDQMLRHVKKGGELLTEDDDQIQKMRIVGLLHDIGHYPLSHTAEHMIMKKLGGKSHVEFGISLIEKFFTKSLGNYKIREITDMIGGRDKSEFGMLISSAFDADKSDYLLRDAYHSGVGYGNIALPRLIRTVSFEKNKIIFEKDESAVESFLIGRYHMYRSVYHHKTVTAFQVMAERIFGMLVTEGYMTHPNEVLKSNSEFEVLNYNDHTLYTAMSSYAQIGMDNYLKELIKMFLQRKPMSMAYIDAMPLESKEMPRNHAMINDMMYDNTKIRALANRSEIDEWQWIFPICLRPLSLIDDDTPIYIKEKGSVKPLASSNALVLQMIGEKTLYDARIYTHPKFKSKMQAYMGGGE